jgi:Cdc6-like AAA superfamily ATPase
MPYNAVDLLEILKNRLGKYTNELFESPKVLELIARTEANSTGDARRLLELCRRVLEGLESLGRKIQTGDVAKFLNNILSHESQLCESPLTPPMCRFVGSL